MIAAEDRIALILGRAVMRAEALQAENEKLRAQLAEQAKPATKRTATK